MNVVEKIQEKILHLPSKAQDEVLEAVERIEERYAGNGGPNDDETSIYPLRAIAELAMDVGVPDLAERHDYYASGKVEN